MASMPQRIEEEVREIFESRTERRFLLLVFLTISVIPPAVFGLGLEAMAVVLLLVAILYLEAIESVNLRIDDELSRPTIIPSHHEASGRITERIDELNPDEIYLLDYSGKYAQKIINRISDTNTEVYLLLKMPQSAINKNQTEEQIQVTLRNGYEADLANLSSDQIHLRLYTQQAAIRGRRIGERFLFLSWYTREYDLEDNPSLMEPETQLEYTRNEVLENKQSLWGHNNPMVEFSSGDTNFKSIDQDFFQDVYQNLWKSGMTPYELYKQEKTYYEEGEYDSDQPISKQLPLAAWIIDDGQIDESKEKYLEQISGSKSEAAELF